MTNRAQTLPRVDAHQKVRGATRYAADHVFEGQLHAAVAVAQVGSGRIRHIDTAAAESASGVIAVITHIPPEELTPDAGYLLGGGYASQSIYPLTTDHVSYKGQPIALVVAESLPAAQHAASLVTADIEPEPVALTLDSPGVEKLMQADAIPLPRFAEIVQGDADADFEASPVQIDRTYDQSAQHPNPMELVSTVAVWQGSQLTIFEGSQNSGAIRFGLAKMLHMDPADVVVHSQYLGGGFGQKNSLQQQTALVAVAARRVGRPVKLVMTRAQLFHDASFRPQSRHHVRLGASRDGLMRALVYEVDSQTSRHDLFPGSYSEAVTRLHGFQSIRTAVQLVRTDVQTPGYMRAPYEQPGVFAAESAVDELAYELGMDPVELRLKNDTDTDPATGKPFSSRRLSQCLRSGADRFGWSRRDPRPGSMIDEAGLLVGWGVAAGAYKGSSAPAMARVTLNTDGRLHVAASSHEMGQGAITAIVEAVVDNLGIDPVNVEVVIGEPEVIPQHLTAGSWGTAAVVPAVLSALDRLREELGAGPEDPVDVVARVRKIGRPVTAEATQLAPGMPESALDTLKRGLVMGGGPEYPEFTAMSWVSHFVEVKVEPTTRRVRVSRVVSTVDCGRVISPVTAESQVRGAVVWGIGAALREQSIPDPVHGGFLNDDLAEYVLPVQADVGEIDVELLNIPDDKLNGPGVKGVGEISLVGMSAAIANAVYHATGRRIRHVPIVLEDLL